VWRQWPKARSSGLAMAWLTVTGLGRGGLAVIDVGGRAASATATCGWASGGDVRAGIGGVRARVL
jgi:hypothetical protein